MGLTYINIRLGSLLLALTITGCGDAGKANKEMEGSLTDGQLMPVLFNEVALEDKFWRPRLKIQADTLVPFALDRTRPAVENLGKTAKFLQGDTTDLPFPHRYVASDLYKVMEGAALSLMENPNPELEKRLDGIVDIIAAAQKDDGYLYEAHITGASKDHDHWGGGGMGDKPYSFVLHSHELYNMGHMYEAAIAYYRATGKDKWLKIAEKNAQHVNRVFFTGDPDYNGGKPVNQAPGHQELELALVKLYHTTGNDLYLEMAKKFLDIRGKTYVPDGEGVNAPTYAQQHMPVAEQEQAVGHAVRAAYMYAAMADVAAITGAEDYTQALDKIWHDITDTKMHITGGLGAVHGIEGFGEEYELPNKEAYNETCAAVGNVLFNHRLFLKHKDAKYMDVAEVALFNNSLAGMNLNGNEFFYVNPLEADGASPFNHGEPGRSPWFNTACCPSNLARMLPQVSGMMYAYTDSEIYLTLYAGSLTRIPLKTGEVSIRQVSEYPFDGKVVVEVHTEKEQMFDLKLRIPTWTGDQFLPGDLYRFIGEGRAEVKLTVNGVNVPLLMNKGFATISRSWKPGDQVTLTLPMAVKFNKANELVEADRNRMAITRGPLVYCAEGVDNSGSVQRFFFEEIPASANISVSPMEEGLMKNIEKISMPAMVTDNGEAQEANLILIPYYAWNNRGDASMIVWFPDQE
jgi:hypothetical protein